MPHSSRSGGCGWAEQSGAQADENGHDKCGVAV